MRVSLNTGVTWGIHAVTCMKSAFGKTALWNPAINIMFAIHIPQESVTIPETMDGIRAAMRMQLTGADGTNETNKYLGMDARG